MLSPEADDSFKSIKEITESIENSNEDFNTDEITIDNNTNYKNIASTNINGNSTNKISNENQVVIVRVHQFRIKPNNSNRR